MSRLSVQQLRKSFKKTTVLTDISFELSDGELLVLLGSSGCGKSTLLRCIAGLEEADSGEIVLGERHIEKLLPKDRNVAMVFQNYSLYPHMTVEKNLSFPLRIAKVQKNEIKKRVAEVAEMIGMTDRLTFRPAQLSGGQRQRVALGRAIIRKPDLFLLDEPLSNLDADLRTRMRQEIVQLQKRTKVTTIHVTHDQTEALTMADRIGLLNNGKLVQLSTPTELYFKPASIFVAEFVGNPKINIIDVQRMVSWGIIDKSTIPEEAKYIGIRPEKLQVNSNGSLRGVVVECEYLGDQYILTVECDSTALRLSSVIQHVSIGETVSLEIDSADALFFNSERFLVQK